MECGRSPCEGANRPEACAKVERGIKIRVQSTDYRGRGEQATSGRDAVAPLPAGGARERQLGWHAVPTLPEARDDAERRDKRAEAAVEGAGQLGQHVVLSLPGTTRAARGAAPTRDRSYLDTRGWIIFGGDGAWGVAEGDGLGN